MVCNQEVISLAPIAAVIISEFLSGGVLLFRLIQRPMSLHWLPWVALLG